MSLYYSSFILFSMLSWIVSCESPILSLDSDTYHDIIDSHSDIIIKHYTSFCRHCKALAPIYIDIANEVKEKYPNLVFAEIDVAENPKIGRELNIQRVPYIVYYKNGKKIEYMKGSKKEDLIEFIDLIARSDENTAIQSLAEKRAKTVQNGIDNGDMVVVAFYPEADTYVLKIIDKAIADVENASRILVIDPEVATLFKVPFPSIQVYKHGKYLNQYNGELSYESFRRWLLLQELPLLIPYTPYYSKKVFNKDLNMNVHVMYFAPTGESPIYKANNQIIERFAKQYQGQLVVLHIPSENHLLLDYFGVKEWQIPTIGIIHYTDKGQVKYLMKQSLTYEHILQFIQQFYKGELDRIYRTEEEPVQNNGPVYKIVGTTFERFVYDPTKDVVVKFYASWCGKSKDFEPIYEEVARKYSKDRSIVFTEFEATKNEVEGIEVNEFPTVILYKAGGDGRSSVMYSGTRELDDFEQFIEKNHLPQESDEL